MINEIWRTWDASKKDSKWFRRLLDEIQMRKRWLITKDRWALNESYATGQYDVAWIQKMYDNFNVDPNELYIMFEPLDLLGNRITSIVSMIEKMSFSPIAKTVDPTARSKKDEDIDLLKAEKELEPLRKKMGQALGLGKPLPIASEEDFSSDISPIAKMGLDISNPIDEGIFRDYLQRQIWEIGLEIGMEYYLNQNKSNEKLKLILADLINHNCCAQQVSTNSYSGQPQLTYIYPYNAYTIGGKQNDGEDAIGKGWEQEVDVRQIIALMGVDITLENLEQLLNYANTNGNTNDRYSGIWFADRGDPDMGFSYPYNVSRDQCCTWAQFQGLKCSLGYLEVKSQNSDLYVHRKENGNLLTDKYDYNYEAPKNIRKVDSVDKIEKDSDRFLEYKFYDVTYKGYYLPFTNLVFGFGKLPLQVRFGSNNELTAYSIITQRLKGKSMTEKCIPFVKHIMSLWAKIQHWINESRASGESFHLDIINELAKEIIGTDGSEGKRMQVLKMLQNMTNTVHMTLKTPDGLPTGGDGDPVKQRIRGLDPTITDLWNNVQRDKEQVIEITGVSDVLLATQSTQAGLGVSQLVLQQSLNTIYYIQSAAQSLFGGVCFNIAQKIQYVVNGDKSAEPYKALVTAIGQRNVDALALMGDTPTFGYGIDIQWGMNAIQRDQVDKLTELLIQSKSITAAQAFQIKALGNWKLAAALISVFESKNAQAQQQAAMGQIKAGSDAEQQKHENKMSEIALTNQGAKDVANTTGEWNYKVEQLQLSGKSSIEDKRQSSKVVHSVQAHEQDMEKFQAEKEFEKENSENTKT